MKLAFTKMQGAGNDFVVLDGVSRRLALTPAQLRRRCRPKARRSSAMRVFPSAYPPAAVI